MLTDTDRSWLKELEAELWPPQDERSPGMKIMDQIAGVEPDFKKPREKLTEEEVLRLFELLRMTHLVVEPVSYGMICGIAIRIYDHEQYIGTDPEYLLCITDKHLPEVSDTSWHKPLLGRSYVGVKRLAGSVRDDAFDLFMFYAKPDRNMRWLEQYKLKKPLERVHYDY